MDIRRSNSVSNVVSNSGLKLGLDVGGRGGGINVEGDLISSRISDSYRINLGNSVCNVSLKVGFVKMNYYIGNSGSSSRTTGKAIRADSYGDWFTCTRTAAFESSGSILGTRNTCIGSTPIE